LAARYPSICFIREHNRDLVHPALAARIPAVRARSFLDHYLVYPLAFASHIFFTGFPPISAGWHLTCIFLPGVLPIRTFMAGKPSAS
jgi:hypothetical protein